MGPPDDDDGNGDHDADRDADLFSMPRWNRRDRGGGQHDDASYINKWRPMSDQGDDDAIALLQQQQQQQEQQPQGGGGDTATRRLAASHTTMERGKGGITGEGGMRTTAGIVAMWTAVVMRTVGTKRWTRSNNRGTRISLWISS